MNDNPLSGFLDEMMASLSQDSREAMVRRVNAERLIKDIAGKFIERNEAEKIRIIPDNRLTEQTGADFLIQIDDYDMRLILLDSPDGKPLLTEQQLTEWNAMMEANPSTTVLIVVWTNDELSAIPFSMRRISSLLEKPEQISKLLKKAEPIEQVVSEVVQRQIKGWKIPHIEESKPTTATRDLFTIFSNKIVRAIDTEANRRYRTDERLRAAKKFPYEQEKKTILNILQDALDGKEAKELEKRLTALPRRGDQ